MANKLTIVNVNRILLQKEQQKIDNEVSYLVKANKENRQKLNQNPVLKKLNPEFSRMTE